MYPNILNRIRGWNKLDVKPGTEPLNGVEVHKLERGHSYLVKEPKPRFSFEIFTSLIKSKCPQCDHPGAFPCESIGCEQCSLNCPCKDCNYTRAQGLCFTMYSPKEVRQRYTLQTTPIFWISSCGSEHIEPADLGMMANIIRVFFKESKNPVVMLDGIEYLTVINGLTSILKFLHDIQEWVIEYNTIFVLPISPLAFEKKELALIERNMDEIHTLNNAND